MAHYESVIIGDNDETWEDLKKTLKASKMSTSAGVHMVATEFLKERQVIGSKTKKSDDPAWPTMMSLAPPRRRASSTDSLPMNTNLQKEGQTICSTHKQNDDSAWPLRMAFATRQQRASSSDNLPATPARNSASLSATSGGVFDNLARRFSTTKVDDDIEEQYTLKRFEDNLEPTNPLKATAASRRLSFANLGLGRKTDTKIVNNEDSGTSDIRGVVNHDIKYFMEGSGELLEEFGSRRASIACLPADSSPIKFSGVVKKRKTWTPASLSSALKDFEDSDSSLDNHKSIDDLFPKRKDHHDLSDSYLDGLAVLAPGHQQQYIRQALSKHDDSFVNNESI